MRTARIRKTADAAAVLLRECALVAPKHSCLLLPVAFDRQDRGSDDQKTSGYGTDI